MQGINRHRYINLMINLNELNSQEMTCPIDKKCVVVVEIGGGQYGRCDLKEGNYNFSPAMLCRSLIYSYMPSLNNTDHFVSKFENCLKHFHEVEKWLLQSLRMCVEQCNYATICNLTLSNALLYCLGIGHYETC